MLNLNRDRVLLELIDSYLDRDIDLSRFEADFTAQYLDSGGITPIDQSMRELFDMVVEKTSWTSASPTEYERKMGWIDEVAFRSWLRRQAAMAKE